MEKSLFVYVSVCAHKEILGGELTKANFGPKRWITELPSSQEKEGRETLAPSGNDQGKPFP